MVHVKQKDKYVSNHAMERLSGRWNPGITEKGAVWPMSRFDGWFDKVFKGQPKMIMAPYKWRTSPQKTWAFTLNWWRFLQKLYSSSKISQIGKEGMGAWANLGNARISKAPGHITPALDEVYLKEIAWKELLSLALRGPFQIW